MHYIREKWACTPFEGRLNRVGIQMRSKSANLGIKAPGRIVEMNTLRVLRMLYGDELET